MIPNQPQPKITLVKNPDYREGYANSVQVRAAQAGVPITGVGGRFVAYYTIRSTEAGRQCVGAAEPAHAGRPRHCLCRWAPVGRWPLERGVRVEAARDSVSVR